MMVIMRLKFTYQYDARDALWSCPGKKRHLKAAHVGEIHHVEKIL